MDNHAKIIKLENKKLALQKEIDYLKKSTGQLDFEEFLLGRNTYSSLTRSGQSTFRVDNIEISLPPIINKDKYYENMLIALKALTELCEYKIEEN